MSATSVPAYLNPRTGETTPLGAPIWRAADDGGPLRMTPLPGMVQGQVDRSTRSLWRYRAALPVPVSDPVTMGEGCTPLIPLPRPLLDRMPGLASGDSGARPRVLLKCEWFMPTGSFKDRGASVMLSLLRQDGIRAVLEDSSGNGGAAVAAYAAAAGLHATIMAPASTSPAKLVQMHAHGAAVERIPGTRQDTADAAVAASARIFYASHNWHPYFLEGTKTLAYELWEDLGFTAPDHVVIPCGAGSNVLGCAMGFGELLRAGSIARLPRLWAAQPAHCAPIVAAFEGRPPDPVRPTIAEGTAIAAPVRLAEVVSDLRASGGGALALTEAEIARATRDLAAAGIYVEPTCAQAAAACALLVEQGRIRPGETAVLVLTGTGLKATPRIAELLGVPA